MRAKHGLSGANPTDRGAYCGFLLKKGRINTALKKRWFILDSEHCCLRYSKEASTKELGNVSLGGAQVDLVIENDEWQIQITVLSGRKYVLLGLPPNPKSKLDDWVDAIGDVILRPPTQATVSR